MIQLTIHMIIRIDVNFTSDEVVTVHLYFESETSINHLTPLRPYTVQKCH